MATQQQLEEHKKKTRDFERLLIAVVNDLGGDGKELKFMRIIVDENHIFEITHDTIKERRKLKKAGYWSSSVQYQTLFPNKTHAAFMWEAGRMTGWATHPIGFLCKESLTKYESLQSVLRSMERSLEQRFVDFGRSPPSGRFFLKYETGVYIYFSVIDYRAFGEERHEFRILGYWIHRDHSVDTVVTTIQYAFALIHSVQAEQEVFEQRSSREKKYEQDAVDVAYLVEELKKRDQTIEEQQRVIRQLQTDGQVQGDQKTMRCSGCGARVPANEVINHACSTETAQGLANTSGVGNHNQV